MLKQILLLTPIYVTIFWAITLNTGLRKNHNPRFFLGKFMFFSVIIYFSHFLYFYSFLDYYAYIDPFYQFASLMVFPLYHIYFRLLTIDSEFNLNKHCKFLLAPTLLFLLYSIGVLFVDFDKYKIWLFDSSISSANAGLRYLNIVCVLIKITFIVQVVTSLIGNNILIRKYGNNAKQYYSDMDESSTNKVRVLNLSMIITGLASLILAALGRDFFRDEIIGIALASVTFSSMLFTIGWLGNRQKSLNPFYEIPENSNEILFNENFSNEAQLKLMAKISNLFVEQKIYMDCTLTIQDVAQAVGTNRTYVSSLINQQYKQNFCTFVNNFRVDELEKVIRLHPCYTNQLLAESCGFGSTDSMKRAVFAKTKENSFQVWKKGVMQSKKI